MEKSTVPSDLTGEQAKALEEAALLVINARHQAAEALEQAGVAAPTEDEDGPFGSPCQALLPPPPLQHRCGCRKYKGNGGPCSNQFGPLLKKCGHLPSQHLQS